MDFYNEEFPDNNVFSNPYITFPRKLKQSQYSKPSISTSEDNSEDYGEEKYENMGENKNIISVKKNTSILSNVQLPKKRDLTYDDILGSMNLKVKDGQLQYISSSKKIPPIAKNYSSIPIITTPIPPLQPLQNTPRMPQLIQPTLKREFNKNIFERRSKSTKLLFTNNATESFIPSIKSTDRFFKLK